MNSEKFTDSNYSLLKALHHCMMAKQYFEYSTVGYKHQVKYFINNIVNLQQSIINKVRLQLPPEQLPELDAELSDSMCFDSIKEALVKLNTEQRLIIENIILLMGKGEEIKIIDDTK